MPRVLLTGFGPFPALRDNPSARIVAKLVRDRRWQRAGIALTGHVFPTTHVAVAADLQRLLADPAPDVVVMLGVAARRRRITVETAARNRVTRLLPDAAGTIPAFTVLPGGPHRLNSAASTLALAAIRRVEPDSRRSHDAGTYLCNASLYRALMLRPSARIVFVHLPRLPERKLERTARVISAAITALVKGVVES